MGLLNDLYDTYNRNSAVVGQRTLQGLKEIELLPIGHGYANMQIEVVVTPNGEFFSAKVVEKKDAATRIPMTEASSSRTNAPVPHPLHDGLKYVAGDYSQYVKEKQKSPTPNELYLQQLTDWCQSSVANERVRAILKYLAQKCLIADLVKEHVLYVEDDELLPKWSTKERGSEHRPEIFSVAPSEQAKVAVRFDVQDPTSSVVQTPVWQDEAVMSSAIAFFTQDSTKKGLDFVTGEYTTLAENHPSNLRYAGDMAKLISANDKQNFTYLGRFKDKDQAATIGYETSQKIHNALKWLIAKQGLTRDGRVYLAWSNELPRVPTPDLSGDELTIELEPDLAQIVTEETTNAPFATKYRRALRGFSANLTTDAKVNVLILDAATPGRLGILYYNSFNAEDYFARLGRWQTASEWSHQYSFVKGQRRPFNGAPSVTDIIYAALGEHASERVLNNYFQTLYACVVEGQRVPWYLCQNLMQRSSRPEIFTSYSQWRKNIEITCSMLKNYYQEGSPVMDENNQDRSYLFGRLLAVAHALENEALWKKEINRGTNAQRYMNAFSAHPEKTWRIIWDNISPYVISLGPASNRYQREMQKISDKFKVEDFNDQPLSGKYFIGFQSQLNQFYTKKEEEK